jgi:two-component system sensor histidine kinase HydH
MQVLGARLGVPLLCSGRVAGAILVGNKAAGRDYSLEERELLTIVARCAAVSLENARLYRDVSHQQRRLDALLAHVTAGVVVVSVNKTVSMINQSAERILQLRAVDVLGRSVQKLGSGFADVVLRVLDDKKPRLRQEVRDPAINASLGLSAAPIGAEGVAVIFSRLPEERTPTEDIAYSPFWEFLASRVAQEIKNPLVAVNTFAQLLPDKYDSADFRDAFGEVVQKEVGRINNVVETLFEFAQHPRLVLRSCDVNETVQNVLKSFEQELDSRAIAVKTELDPGLPLAELDPQFFSQAVQNVVQNSMEAMPSGGTLTVRTRKRDRECEVVIADTGPGVSEQDAPMIFAPFFSTKEQGMGLGLTVADRIMRQHDGGLSLVTSEEGGSAFSFRVPSSRTTNADSPRGG